LKPRIEINITQPVQVNDSGSKSPTAFQDIEIVGNREGLLLLAEIVQRVADSDQNGYHTHIYPDDDPRLLRSDAFSITISKVAK